MPNNVSFQKKQAKKVDITKRIIMIKKSFKPWKQLRGFNWKKYLGYILIRFISLFVSEEKLKCKFVEAQTQYNSITSDYNYFPAGVSRYGKWVIERDVLENLTMVKFEDDLFYVPSDSDQYLKSCYGDYMKLPPESKRNIGHSIVKVVFL